jgi:tetratricopeptide (TPR) repeat protein
MENDERLAVLQREYDKNPADHTAALSLAQYYYNIGWFNEAIAIYKSALEHHPDDSGLLLEYGITVYKKGDYKTALHLFSRLTEERPDRIEGWNNLGITQIQLEQFDAAYDSFSNVLELEPENSGALLNMGNYHFSKEHYEEAYSLFERACSVKVDFPDAWFNLGNTAIKCDRYDRAREAFKKALRYQREFPSALKNLGWVYEHQGEYGKAAECYQEALQGNKADAHLHVNLGDVYLRQRKYDEAKKCFLKAVRLAPNDLHGWMGLRGYALAKGDIGTFMRATMAILARMDDEMLAQSIEMLYELNQLDKAEELLAQADRLGRSSDLIDLQRLLIWQRVGKYPEKVAALAEKLSDSEIDSDTINRGMARYYLEIERYDSAETSIRKIAIRDDAECGILWRAMLGNKKNRDVRKLIRAHMAEHPESYDGYFLLAVIEAQRGNVKRAETLLVYALDHGFSNMDELHRYPTLNEIFESMTGKKLLEEA